MVDPQDRRHDAQDIARLHDRRRPGRIEYTNPHLIALLRRSSSPAAHAAEGLTQDEPEDLVERDRADDLRPAVGIAVGIPIAILLWVALIWIARYGFALRLDLAPAFMVP